MSKKSPFKIVLVTVAVASAAILIWANTIAKDIPKSHLNTDRVKPTPTNELNEFEKQVSLSGLAENTKTFIGDNAEKPPTYKKVSLNDEWCLPFEQLDRRDQRFVAQLQQDWNEYSGVSYYNMDDIGYGDEIFDLTNFYIEPYKDLPVDDLETLALEGNKWAMVAYLQVARFVTITDEQRQVAHQLMVIGASYHAVGFLIIDELVLAKAIFRKTKNHNLARKHLINAVAYALIGIDSYHISALTAYVSNISSDETFKLRLNPEFLLADAQEEITARYIELTEEFKKKREEQLIAVKEPPEAIRKLFAIDLAGYQMRHGKILSELQRVNVTNKVNLNETECTREHIRRLTKAIGQE